MSHDEFELYDLSEFTEEDLTRFDTIATKTLLPKVSPTSESQQDISAGPVVTRLSSFGGGPALDIAIESRLMRILLKKFLNLPPKPLHVTSPPVSGMPNQTSNLYKKFLSWRNAFSVTDLVSPVWCEVQYEYGLYGERHKPLEKRPPSFTSRDGKTIQVKQNVAQQNAKTLKRGTSIHKHLELEMRPKKVFVRTSNDEERWALRLFNLTAGLEQLIFEGITRELPVFGITHGQVVFGIIDEVTRRVPSEVNKLHNPVKRSLVPSESSPVKKKQRRSPSPSQNDMPVVCPNRSTEETRAADQPPTEEEICDNSMAGSSILWPIHPEPTFYDLTLIDYKTRRVPSLPPDEDTVSSQMQLMLYHRLLSPLLSPETFDFDALWAKQSVKPHRSFSREFVEDIGLLTKDDKDLPFHVDLSSMVAAWVSVVHSARSSGERLRGVHPELQIIYRKAGVKKDSVHDRKQKAKTDEMAVDNPPGRLAPQEELDIARAVEESLRPPAQDAGEASTSRPADQSIETASAQSEKLSNDEVIDLTSPVGENPEPTLVVQDSLPADTCDNPDFNPQSIAMKGLEATPVADELTDLEDNGTLPDRNGDFLVEEDTSGLSTILGTRKFFMDEDRLDAHLTDVLRWWFGFRPPRGVELAQSNRCGTCEYLDSCEWRERKAFEASSVALGKRKATQSSSS
ncbi:exonuclease V a 5' deoxyribonuclease-domain-containing protein [Suillus subalutaceus]|uniref:exonuclease V a 5' deoxyribonuclease-domain-containing protein n=1 Tax=Suillus subalutaceus TaxID=48586 RepID=UPI001B86366B|nr:exonuclease V a 5' deoxyribonuclease-domain-containing protein [Suillus subalutaceus]KAG1839232.1 exonuclease V a 5' deoxyribonuclease-domain-containing protein [Suillus subalutaceus]